MRSRSISGEDSRGVWEVRGSSANGPYRKKAVRSIAYLGAIGLIADLSTLLCLSPLSR
jgi:hypothetical protein